MRRAIGAAYRAPGSCDEGHSRPGQRCGPPPRLSPRSSDRTVGATVGRAAVTKRELDQTKGELVRALRRKAAEIDHPVPTLDLGETGGPVPGRRWSTAAAQPRKPVAFFMRETF